MSLRDAGTFFYQTKHNSKVICTINFTFCCGCGKVNGFLLTSHELHWGWLCAVRQKRCVYVRMCEQFAGGYERVTYAVSVSKNISDGAAFSICSVRCSRSVSSSSICLHVREAMRGLHSSLGVEE